MSEQSSIFNVLNTLEYPDWMKFSEPFFIHPVFTSHQSCNVVLKSKRRSKNRYAKHTCICVCKIITEIVCCMQPLSSAEVSRIPLNFFKFSVVCLGNYRKLKEIQRNSRNSLRRREACNSIVKIGKN